MIKRRFWPNHYFFWRRQLAPLDYGDPSLPEVVAFGDGRSIQQFLSQYKDDLYAMDALRGLLGETRQWVDVSRLTSDQALAEIAHLILAGRLGVAIAPRPFSIGVSEVDKSADLPPAPAGAPVSSTPSEEPEPATLPPDLNAVAQAAALSAAAASGAPFCAQCQAAALAAGNQ
jgi:hypothetical protein